MHADRKSEAQQEEQMEGVHGAADRYGSDCAGGRSGRCGVRMGTGADQRMAVRKKVESMLKVKLILENGLDDHFYLSDTEVRKLEYEVEQQNIFNQEKNYPMNYTMAAAIRLGLYEYLKRIPDPAKKQKPQRVEPPGNPK